MRNGDVFRIIMITLTQIIQCILLIAVPMSSKLCNDNLTLLECLKEVRSKDFKCDKVLLLLGAADLIQASF